jgi:transcriptional regulator with XRE-family HTH domain
MPERERAFGEWLRDLRKKRGLSQRKLAKLLGTSQSRVCEWEQGRAFPQGNSMQNICKVFDVNIEEPYDYIQRVEIQNKVTSVIYTPITPDNYPSDQINPHQEKLPSSPLRRRRSSKAVLRIIGIAAAAVLILSLVVGFFVLPVWQTCGGAFSGEFQSHLDSRWTWVNPTGKATYGIPTKGSLTLFAPPHSDISSFDHNFKAPRLLQPINGNFTIDTTLVDFHPNTNFQSAGILIEQQDQTRWLRFERGFGGKNSGVFFQEDDYQGPPVNPGKLEQHLTTAGSVELRIQRQGDQFIASWRVPGQIWQPVGDADYHFDGPILAGLDVIADFGAPKTTATYAYFNASCPLI